MITVDPTPARSTRELAPGMTLGDARPITYLRISVTDRCNLRCRYCMPESQEFLDRSHVLSYEEITRVAEVLVARGVRKIRITGGEPLLRRDLPMLVEQLKRLDGAPELALTTNGILLDRFASSLRDAGLDRLNVSLDTLRANRYERLARRPGLDAVLRGLDAAAAAGFEGTKLNTVVMGGFNDDEVADLLDFSVGRGLEQRFIEFMPMASNDYGLDADRVPLAELRRRVEAVGELQPLGRGTGPAEVFRLAPTGQRVGFIAAISQPFCETCNRVRLTADGVLRSCLFEGGEVAIKPLVRSDGELAPRLGEAFDWVRRVKPEVHDGYGHVQMNRVGG